MRGLLQHLGQRHAECGYLMLRQAPLDVQLHQRTGKAQQVAAQAAAGCEGVLRLYQQLVQVGKGCLQGGLQEGVPGLKRGQPGTYTSATSVQASRAEGR